MTYLCLLQGEERAMRPSPWGPESLYFSVPLMIILYNKKALHSNSYCKELYLPNNIYFITLN